MVVLLVCARAWSVLCAIPQVTLFFSLRANRIMRMLAIRSVRGVVAVRGVCESGCSDTPPAQVFMWLGAGSLIVHNSEAFAIHEFVNGFFCCPNGLGALLG